MTNKLLPRIVIIEDNIEGQAKFITFIESYTDNEIHIKEVVQKFGGIVWFRFCKEITGIKNWTDLTTNKAPKDKIFIIWEKDAPDKFADLIPYKTDIFLKSETIPDVRADHIRIYEEYETIVFRDLDDLYKFTYIIIKFCNGEIGILCCFLCNREGDIDSFITIDDRISKLDILDVMKVKNAIGTPPRPYFWFHDLYTQNICEACLNKIFRT